MSKLLINNQKSNAIDIIRDMAWDVYGFKSDRMGFVCLRGMTINASNQLEVNDNKIDHWNDTIMVFGKGGYAKHYLGTVDPGMYWVKNPMVKEGTAYALPGITKLRIGLHRGQRAFVQSGDFVAYRDGDKDAVWQEKKIHLVTASNLHAAYRIQAVNKIDIVGSNSAVCTVPKILWADPIWINEFIGLADQSKQSSFYRIFIDVSEVALYIGEKYNGLQSKDFTKILYENRQKLERVSA